MLRLAASYTVVFVFPIGSMLATGLFAASKIVVFASLGVVLYSILGQPVFNFYMPWGYWIYLAISLIVGFVAGGFVLAKWFVPHGAAKLAGTTVH